MSCKHGWIAYELANASHLCHIRTLENGVSVSFSKLFISLFKKRKQLFIYPYQMWTSERNEKKNLNQISWVCLFVVHVERNEMFCSQYSFCSMRWLEMSNFMIISCIWVKIWAEQMCGRKYADATEVTCHMGRVRRHRVYSTRGTGNQHWTWQMTMVQPDGWRAIGNDFILFFVCAVFFPSSLYAFVRMLQWT